MSSNQTKQLPNQDCLLTKRPRPCSEWWLRARKSVSVGLRALSAAVAAKFSSAKITTDCSWARFTSSWLFRLRRRGGAARLDQRLRGRLGFSIDLRGYSRRTQWYSTKDVGPWNTAHPPINSTNGETAS